MTTQEARKLVADALRSGKYEQGAGTLRRVAERTYSEDLRDTLVVPLEKPQYCCLGVACEVYNEHATNPLVVRVDGCYTYYDDNVVSYLPAAVQKWLGMNASGRFNSDEPFKSLVQQNDLAHATFKKIADLFETADFVAATTSNTEESL